MRTRSDSVNGSVEYRVTATSRRGVAAAGVCGTHIAVTALREVDLPRIAEVRYELWIDTDESADRIDLLRRNIEKFGTIYNTVAAACEINGTIRRISGEMAL